MADLLPEQQVPTSFDPQFGEAQGMIAPGQEEMAQQFMADPQPEPQPDPLTGEELIGGKFKSQEDLLKAYQELERKQSQASGPDSADLAQPQRYTPEQAVEVYGDDIVNAVGEAGLNMAELMWQADNGGDISEHYDALAEAVGVPRQVVENYVSKAQAQSSEEAGLSAEEGAAIKNEFGGEEEFNRLSAWARDGGGLTETELAAYNATVDSGNKDAIRWALRAIQAKANQGQSTEPKLIRGQAPATERRKFNSEAEVLEAMNKRDSRGRKLYEVDTAYQQKFAEVLKNSDLFG